MLFNSYQFLVLFLPLCWAGFWLLRQARAGTAVAWLVGASLTFYACWKPVYLVLLLGSLAVNFALCRVIGRAPRRARWLIGLGVALNLMLLGGFKYAGFAVDSVNALAGQSLFTPPALLLPLAISFFTFQQIAFLVDIGRGHLAAPKFLHYAAAVTFFPHLIAGPIVQYRDMVPQFDRMAPAAPAGRDLAAGVALFAAGLFKKQVIADPCGEIADRLFDHGGAAGASLLDAWTGVFAYTGQLYFDFSAYSDMALGLAHLFGIVLPRNFNSPYQATSIIDFWRRWHMTLSGFLRNYLYIPLGGSLAGPWSRARNLMLTMLLGGLWHGAGWTFVFWGGLHGLYLCLNHAWRGLGLTMPRALGWMLTLLAVAWAWVLFRAHSLDVAFDIWSRMSGGGSGTAFTLFDQRDGRRVLLTLAAAVLLPNAVNIVRARWSGERPLRFAALAGALIGAMLVLGLAKLEATSEFLYFNF